MSKIKLVIEIDEEIYFKIVNIYEYSFITLNKEQLGRLDGAIRRSMPLPKNPTNGDMIKALFPDFHPLLIGNEMVGHSSGASPYFIECNFDADWWNTLYKRSGI